MSMDDVYLRARELSHGLEQFNLNLKAVLTEVEQAHALVAPLWDDAMSREYHQQWDPMEDNLKEYARKIGPQYVDFLLQRLRHLHVFLHGHGS
jgi:hypothetical protein